MYSNWTAHEMILIRFWILLFDYLSLIFSQNFPLWKSSSHMDFYASSLRKENIKSICLLRLTFSFFSHQVTTKKYFLKNVFLCFLLFLYLLFVRSIRWSFFLLARYLREEGRLFRNLICKDLLWKEVKFVMTRIFFYQIFRSKGAIIFP